MQRHGVRQISLRGQVHAWVPGVPVCVRHELYLMANNTKPGVYCAEMR